MRKDAFAEERIRATGVPTPATARARARALPALSRPLALSRSTAGKLSLPTLAHPLSPALAHSRPPALVPCAPSAQGALLGGKLAAEVIVDQALGQPTRPLKAIQPEIVAKAAAHEPAPPPGVKGDGAIAFGGGAVLSKDGFMRLREVDAAQFDGEESADELADEPEAAEPEPVAA